MTLKTTPGLIRPTRRRFLAGTSAGVAAAGLGLSPRGARAQPQRGGTIRVAKGHGSTSDTLDPATTENGFMIALTYGLNGFLTGIGAGGAVEPELAESWEASADAAQWRIKLRQGATFHDGRDVTAEDVVASINYHRGEDSASAAKPLIAGITDLAAEGGDTIVFTLSSGDADFPYTMADYHLAILPSSEGAVDWRAGIGCGPYRLTEFEPGVSARLERFAEDWNQDRGWFDAVEMLSIIDVNARTSALVSGDVHAIDKLDLKTVALMARNPDLAVHSVDGNQHYTFAMSTNQDPYTDRNVRLALKHAINREELVEKLLYGYGSVGNDHPIGRGQRFYAADLEQRSFDPDRARFHLREAGLDTLTVELAAADAAFPGAVDGAILFQNAAASADITIDVARKPNDGYWSDVWMKHPFSAVYWGGRPTEDGALTIAYAAGAAWNDTFWDNERFNELLVQARSELDEDKRREMYHELQAILNEDGGVIVPMFANYVFATRPEVVTGDAFSSHWDMDGERWMERWSFG